jgi:tripartite-type tricarboxylate transporter receptor subunit TctC
MTHSIFTRRVAAVLVAGAGASAFVWQAFAQAEDWPTEPITIVVAYPAGGGTDTTIRAMTEIMSAKLGQPILVQNVGGAGGGVAAAQVAQAEPDGYTLLATNSTSVTLAPLVQQAPYSMDSFEPVALLGEFQNAYFTGADAPYDTLDELIEFAKEQGRPIKGASQLALDRLVMQYIAKQRGVEYIPVPVQGGSGSVQAVMSGDVDVAFSGGSWAPIVEAGDAKALFAASYEPLKMAPDLVTMKDLGFEFGTTAFIPLYAPAGTPEDVIQKMAAAAKAGVEGEMAQNVGEQRFMDMTFRGPEEAEQLLQKEHEVYEELVKSVGPGN